MPSFPDSIFLFVLALLLFGPKRLPVLARELGKWVGEFRRASNEFKMQMEDELRLSEQAERNKQIAAMEAAAPVAPVISAETPVVPARTAGVDAVADETAVVETAGSSETTGVGTAATDEAKPGAGYEVVDGVKTPLPIAVSGDLKIMPPSTGLPAARGNGLHGLLDAMPAAESSGSEPERSLGAAVTAGDSAESTETTVHGN